MRVKSLEFFDYKSFSKFSISARTKNILVGPNNTGKSTSLDALRIASDALRYARRRTAQFKSQGKDGICSTYYVPQSVVRVDLRYCVRNFQESSAKITVIIENGKKFVISLDPDADLECYLVSEVQAQKNTKYLASQFPAEIIVVPTLSPLEQNEELVRLETVERNRYGRLASRNFRNFWLHKTKSEFEEFADLVEYGWPGIRIRKPEVERGDSAHVRMYFRDGANVREVQWAGFGFQVWMQTMMHLTQSDHRSILVLDEPDIYLHPDLQHRLLRLVSERVGQFFIATHSTEIINAADPGDVLIVRPSARSAKRIRTETNYSEVYSAIGSSENAQFARLARTRKVLYFEGLDNRLLSRVSKKLGGIDYLSGSSVTIMKTDGFSNWSKVTATASIFKKFFELDVQVAALFDRDYRPDAEVEDFKKQMVAEGAACFVLPFKEIENILLVPRAISAVVVRYADGGVSKSVLAQIEAELERLIELERDRIFGQQLGHVFQFRFRKAPKADAPSLADEFRKQFSDSWKCAKFRRQAVPGKTVFRSMARYVQEQFKVSLSGARVVDELLPGEIHPEVTDILVGLRAHFGEPL